MTLLDAPATHAVNEPQAPASESSARRAPSGNRRRVTRVCAIALLVVVAALALFEVFEGPVARTWYQTRQRQLAADLRKPHTSLERGDAIAVLQIPRLGINVVVAEGDDPQQLRGGPGHRRKTPMPGEKGNMIIAGHRSGWGGPLASLARVRKGDLIAVSIGAEPEPVVYKVVSVARTNGSDRAPLAPANDHRLTIVTGDKDRLSSQRLVVTAVSGTNTASPKTATTKPATATPTPRAATGPGSLLWNQATFFALVGALGIALTVLVLRKSTRVPALVAVLVPFGALLVLGALLEIDLLIPPLR
jgi:LPXTG-site transpeptidase (sortase) family protein